MASGATFAFLCFLARLAAPERPAARRPATRASSAGANGSPRLRRGTSRLSLRRHWAMAVTVRAAKDIPTPPRANKGTKADSVMSSAPGATAMRSVAGLGLGARNFFRLTGASRSSTITMGRERPLSMLRRRVGMPIDWLQRPSACWDITVMDPGFSMLTVCWQRPSLHAVSDSVCFTGTPWSWKVSERTSCTFWCICPSRPGAQYELLIQELVKLLASIGFRNWPLLMTPEEAANTTRSLLALYMAASSP
mmetsp:Transcript_25923/g.53771  ORF Transcript_25923/g.53771 Transcript_25923/m.53771 type:complete len:251 (+) Transcript_25923:439-1191(+)